MDRNAVRAEGFPVASQPLSEAAGDGGLAMRATAFGCQVIAADIVPVADDQRRLAARAEGGAALAVMDVAGEYVVQPGIECDLAGPGQGLRRRWRQVVH